MTIEMIQAIASGFALLLTIWIQYRLKVMENDLKKVAVHTNSMHTAMVIKTEEEAHARGLKEGKEGEEGKDGKEGKEDKPQEHSNKGSGIKA